MNPRPPDCVLRCTQSFGPRQNLSFEEAAQFLHQLCQGPGANLTYSWQFIDRPNDGDVYVYFQVSAPTPLMDGLQYLEPESSYRQSQDLEVHETRFGFIPGINGEKEASRVRKRYRLAHGGHPNIVLVHYTRGPAKPVPPTMNIPVRSYPLPIINEPPMYVIGEKSGQRVMPPNAAQLVNQQQQLEALTNSRRQAAAGMQPQAPNMIRRPDEDSDEESNRVSTRALAVTRFKRNHELLAEIFAVNAVANAKAIPSPYEKIDQAELEAKLAKANEEVAALQEKVEQQDRDLQEAIATEEAAAPPQEPPKATA
ncbi:SWI/SNF complex protein [Ceratobasidium sp. AG-Ba]|nr:SWI/SNF complex protein [Ceratobasidium sp. AG-Ba]